MTKSPEDYKWSSLTVYLKGKSNLPFTLHWKWILSLFGFILEGIKDKRDPGEKAVGGWILGSKRWIEKVIDKWGYFFSKELSGIKPIKPRIPIADLEKLVCNEFKVEEEDLKKATYNNIAWMAIIFLTLNYCGLTLKETGQRYGGSNYSAVSKAASRFLYRLAKDCELHKKIKHIVAIIEM